jgi:hypothetical protein
MPMSRAVEEEMENKRDSVYSREPMGDSRAEGDAGRGGGVYVEMRNY